MPFRTKRQKIAAAQRKFVFSEGKVSLVTDEKLDGKKEAGHYVVKTKIEDKVLETKEDLRFVRRDVLKTLVIASLIIVFQLIILLRIN